MQTEFQRLESILKKYPSVRPENLIGLIDIVRNLKLGEVKEFENKYPTLLKEALKKDIQKHLDSHYITLEGYTNALVSTITSERFCIVGGYGHHVELYQYVNIGKFGYSFKPLPHHWVIRSECYAKAKLDDFESFILKVQGIELIISPTAETEQWGN